MSYSLVLLKLPFKNSGEEGPNPGGCWDDYEECLENALREVCMMMILKGELW